MNRTILTSMTLFLLVATTATALTLDGNCDIRFFGQSTLHGFEGKVACQPFTLTSAGETGEDKIIRQTVVEVLVVEMDTDNSGRDTKMRDMFEQKSYPLIQGLFADIDPDLVLQQLQGVESAPGRLEFDLRIREISQRVQAMTRDLVMTPEHISFAMEFPLSLTSFQLQPPSALGFIKVKDQIQVKVRVLLQRH
ncbi:MAG: YceI family protein [Desulfuromonadales bacterium]